MDNGQDGERDSAALGDELIRGFAGRVIRAKVHRICRALHLSRHDGEDLEQELRLELLIRAAKFDPARGTWEAYVHCVANSRARTHFRRLRRLPRPMPYSDVFADSNDADCISEGDQRRHRGLDSDSEAMERQHDIEFLRDQLDLDAQMLTDMLKVWSVTETSVAMEMPRSTVADRIRKLQWPFSALGPEIPVKRHQERTPKIS